MNKILSFFVNLPTKWYLVSIGFIAAILRLISITKASIWHDEGYTAMLIQFNPIEIIERTARDFHPPLYYLVTHGWSLVFGDSELALRSLSLVFGVGIVILTYFIVKKLKFTEATARLATLFVAFAPFIIRYSEEARMYGMAAFLIGAATLAMLSAIAAGRANSHKKHLAYWLVYGALMAAALYTHYYVGFMVFVHVGYAWWAYGGLKNLAQTKAWWAGNLLAAGAFGLWIPTVVSQFTRVQGGYWIPPVDAESLPNTFMQFMAYSSNTLPSSIELLLTMALACYVTFTIARSTKSVRPKLLFLAGWTLVPLIAIMLISLAQPVYYDRYFVYASIGFYILLAALLTNKNLRNSVKVILATLILAIFSFGILNVDKQATHQMSTIGKYVSQEFEDGDVIVSGELYTYFDFSYYNQTGETTRLLSSDKLSGYGETSLIYDRQDEVVVRSLDDIDEAKRVWVIGKPGEKDYFTELIPSNWKLKSRLVASDSAVQLYVVNEE